ncbi:hypothetical protein [Streptomyces sp. NPDC002133]|uniref:hypothetical protein n=1 Tax=Streptomyces sp. NPDC002133 TaxID=3154409 RepID=UPI003330767E
MGKAWAGELRALWNAPVWAVVSGVGLVSFLTVSRIWLAGAEYGVVDSSVASLTQPAAALRASAWQISTLLGLLLTGVLVATTLGQALEGGTWSMLRLHEHRVSRLLFRKAGAVLLALLTAQLMTAVLLCMGVILLSRIFPIQSRVGAHGNRVPSPTSADVVTWGEAAAAVASTMLVQILFVAMTACAAALLRSVIGTLALGLGPILVTSPLVLLPVAPLLPQRWVADLLGLPSEAQFQLYFWNQAPPDPDPAIGGLALAASAVLLMAAAWHLLRSERSLKPVD